MSKPYSVMEELQQLLHRKKSKQYYAEKLGISILRVETLLQQLKSPVTSTTEDIKAGTSELSARFDTEIRTLEELIEKCKIDLKVWHIDRYVQNFWGNRQDPHWQVKVFLSRRVASKEDALMKALHNYKSAYIPLKKSELIDVWRHKKPVAVLISLADPHIDKQTLDKTTIEQKMKTYLIVLKNLLAQAFQSQKIDEVVLVLGNDYFTSDTYHGTTTNYTPQHTTDEYDKA